MFALVLVHTSIVLHTYYVGLRGWYAGLLASGTRFRPSSRTLQRYPPSSVTYKRIGYLFARSLSSVWQSFFDLVQCYRSCSLYDTLILNIRVMMLMMMVVVKVTIFLIAKTGKTGGAKSGGAQRRTSLVGVSLGGGRRFPIAGIRGVAPRFFSKSACNLVSFESIRNGIIMWKQVA